MFNLEKWRGNSKAKRQQEFKERVLKNREAVLDIMASNVKGGKNCSFLLGNKCLGILCEQFLEWKNINSETGKEFTYYRCVFQQTPLLLIELIRDVNLLRKEMVNAKNTKDSV